MADAHLVAAPPVRAIFASLSGDWALRRTLTSNLASFPSGTFSGTATFTPVASHSDPPTSYHYVEQGTLTTDAGLQFHATRDYFYIHDAAQDKLSAWFATDGDQGGGEDRVPDYLYHDLEFAFEGGRWVARGDHLCVKDMYWAFYDFRLGDGGGSGSKETRDGDVELQAWGVKHIVKGPEKDYSTDSAYTRIPAAGSDPSTER